MKEFFTRSKGLGTFTLCVEVPPPEEELQTFSLDERAKKQDNEDLVGTCREYGGWIFIKS